MSAPPSLARLVDLPPIETRQTLTRRDTMLYALGVGVGAVHPGSPDELKYVYERGLCALPTMAVVLAYPGFWMREPQYGIDWRQVLHGEQALELHRPLPVEGELVGLTKVEAVIDKGPDKGALVITRRDIRLSNGTPLATVRQTSLLRGDGGRGGTTSVTPALEPTPNRPPDLVRRTPTALNQALLYRLSGDYNPLHVDPDVAREAGFPAPILHGLATFGIVGRGLLAAAAAEEPSRVRTLSARFSSPVFPGDTLEVHLWREADGLARFQARALERDTLVLRNGLITFEV